MYPYGVLSLIVTAITLPIFAIVVVLLRFYVRLQVRPTYLAADDWLILLSVFLVCGHVVIQILGIQHSFPRPSRCHEKP